MSERDDLVERAELRSLVEAYAHGVDRRRPEAVAALFTDHGRLEIYEGDETSEPTRVRDGRAEIAAALAGLARYDVTTHLLGQQTVELDGDRATGETYCIAHHISSGDGARHDHVLSIRYLDTFRRDGDAWRFERRRLVIDWTDERDLST